MGSIWSVLVCSSVLICIDTTCCVRMKRQNAFVLDQYADTTTRAVPDSIECRMLHMESQVARHENAIHNICAIVNCHMEAEYTEMGPGSVDMPPPYAPDTNSLLGIVEQRVVFLESQVARQGDTIRRVRERIHALERTH